MWISPSPPFRWNHLWLNEGLTSFYEWYGKEAVYEKSFVWQKFFLDSREYALEKDADYSKSNYRPLVPKSEWIKTENDAYKMFSPGWIRYNRGACMVAMLRSMLGDKVFLSSITSYLTTFAYSTVVTRDFFNFLDKPAKKLGAVPLDSHLKDFMEPWVNRSGYPVVYLVRNMTNNTVWNLTKLAVNAVFVAPRRLIYTIVTGSSDPGENVLGEKEGTSR